jgi:hypothetical protein
MEGKPHTAARPLQHAEEQVAQPLRQLAWLGTLAMALQLAARRQPTCVRNSRMCAHSRAASRRGAKHPWRNELALQASFFAFTLMKWG